MRASWTSLSSEQALADGNNSPDAFDMNHHHQWFLGLVAL